MDLQEYKKLGKDSSPGWDAITENCKKIYGEQDPQHYTPILSKRLGGDEYLDGISIYTSQKQEEHLHFVTYGFSQLHYDEEKFGKEFSNFGFEFTLRLKKSQEMYKNGIVNFLQNVGKYVFQNGKWFEEFHFMPANSQIVIADGVTIVGFGVVLDKELGKISTPHGEVQFLQIIGFTQEEIDEVMERRKKSDVEKIIKNLEKDNDLLILDLFRN